MRCRSASAQKVPPVESTVESGAEVGTAMAPTVRPAPPTRPSHGPAATVRPRYRKTFLAERSVASLTRTPSAARGLAGGYVSIAGTCWPALALVASDEDNLRQAKGNACHVQVVIHLIDPARHPRRHRRDR